MEPNSPDITEEKDSLEVTAEVYNPQETPWENIKKQIMSIEETAFPDFEADEEVLGPDFQHPDNSVILLKKGDGTIIGYSYAEPISHLHPERTSEDQETAYVTSTAIAPEYQGKKLLKPLLTKLDSELIKKGYSFAERDAAIANGYADTLENFYGDRVVAKEDRYNEDLEIQQRFMRIKLQVTQPAILAPQS